ncbi:hypothetical protein F5Y18DRAFT_424611 [Xylariaceae sp. FL1019]|nr:hypothetical protein F5Y18DRAFT_424611 [Xylariaceae sp. FL1019]
MVFELHVWGPALGLDSIDAECLAAIAYFRYVLPSQDWSLVASNDVSVCPDNILPALFHDNTWTSGYTKIISYLRQHSTSLGKPLPDDDLTPQQNADLLAYSSYLTTRGAGLIALSLYASPNAWVDVTRPAYATLLTFPLTWTVPLSIRNAAIEKAEHMGFGYLAEEAESEQENARNAVETTSTGFLRLRQQLGLKDTLQPEQKAAIRLQRLADDFFSTLDDALQSSKYFLGTSGPTSLDFLAYGYLSLMAVETPYPIISRALKRNNRPSFAFLQTIASELEVYSLPRKDPIPRSVIGRTVTFGDFVIENIAGVGDGWKRWRRGGIKPYEGENARDMTSVVFAFGGIAAALSAVGASILFKGMAPAGAETHRFEPERGNKGLARFGELGAMLDGLPMFE